MPNRPKGRSPEGPPLTPAQITRRYRALVRRAWAVLHGTVRRNITKVAKGYDMRRRDG